MQSARACFRNQVQLEVLLGDFKDVGDVRHRGEVLHAVQAIGLCM